MCYDQFPLCELVDKLLLTSSPINVNFWVINWLANKFAMVEIGHQPVGQLFTFLCGFCPTSLQFVGNPKKLAISWQTFC